MNIGFILLALLLILVAHYMGFWAGMRHITDKIYEVFGYDTYREILQGLRIDIDNKKEKEKKFNE